LVIKRVVMVQPVTVVVAVEAELINQAVTVDQAW
jgi:hypothetical protein